MGCCGGGGGGQGGQSAHTGHQGHEEAKQKGKINWVQIVAVGLVLMFLLGILLQVWH